MDAAERQVFVNAKITNDTNHRLVRTGCYVAWGQLYDSQPDIDSGSTETMLCYKTKFLTTGSTMLAVWEIEDTNTYLFALWSAPWNHNHHVNLLAIGFRYGEPGDIGNDTYQEMYDNDQTWFKRKEFYNNMQPVQVRWEVHINVQ